MARERPVGRDVIAVLALAAVFVLIANAVGDVSLAILTTLIVFVMLSYAMFRVPVRHSVMTMMFFAFALPNPNEGQPSKWDPPFTKVGAILLDHLNSVDRSLGALSALAFSGMDALIVVLLIVILTRRASMSKVDTYGTIPSPKPLRRLALVSLGSGLFVWFSGLIRGGDFTMSLWQVYYVVYLPILYFLFQYCLRGPEDHPGLVRVLLGAATYKCLLAVYIVNTVVVTMDLDTGSTRPLYATAHADSMLFATGFIVIFARLLEMGWQRGKGLAAVFLPILSAGTLANNRRLAWVQVGLVFLTVYFVSRESNVKRLVRRALLALAPVFAVYIAMGWNSLYGSLFKPVRMIRSIVDAKTDNSSLWREYENVNIIATFRQHPLFGTGYGHPYEEVIVLPSVDYALERYVPHNSLLGLWAYCGYVGFAGITLLWVAGVYFAMRAYYKGTNPEHRAAALVCIGVVLIYLMQCWGDLGLITWTGVFLMGPALAVAGKLALATGQWDPKSK